ncbi:unnamed protein product [Bemisia tabaci]|uniref:SUMO-activating enzyme subunit 1 n=1 Tax=Bemisia tabaci TaxID=7038 RepID=A0A9P0AHN7_BEMTA|nr:unnamed protein product [Bemisia tabaci]
MVEGNRIELTEDEAELYDRQIRLWGLESQKRLRAAKVLVIGMSGLGAEVTKNIVLAGVKSLTMMDGSVATKEDLCSQFFIPHSELGKNRAEASVERAQQLNPMVEVKAVPHYPEKFADEPDFYTKFDIVCATRLDLPTYLKINTICRNANVKFFCADVFGTFGYHFSDLQNHEYAEEETKQIAKPVLSSHTPNKRAKMEKEAVKVTVKKTDKFVPLQAVVDMDWKNEENKKKLNEMDSSFILSMILLSFRSKQKRDPSPATREEDIKLLQSIRDEFLTDKSVPLEKVPDECFRTVFAEVSPSCAVVGGVLAQEIIKVVSQKGAPHNNLFLFNPLSSCGTVVSLGNIPSQNSKQEPVDLIDLDDD